MNEVFHLKCKHVQKVGGGGGGQLLPMPPPPSSLLHHWPTVHGCPGQSMQGFDQF